MASSAVVSVCSVAGETILPAVQISDHEDIRALTKQVQEATSANHVTLVSKAGKTLVDSLPARDNGIASGDQLTAVFGKHDILWLLPMKSEYILRYDITAGTVRGYEHGARCRSQRPFGGAVCVGTKTYFMPIDADAMLIYSSITEEMTSVDITGYAEGNCKFSTALAASGKVYFVPGSSDQLLVYDVDSCEFSGVDITHVSRGRGKWHTAALARDYIIAFPCSAKAVLVYNIVTGEASGIPVGLGYRLRGFTGYPLVHDGGEIYVLPNQHSKMLIYDCDSQAVTQVDVGIDIGSHVWVGGTVVDGRLFALPLQGDTIWRYDLVFQTSSLIDISMLGGRWSKITNIDGVIYGAPYTCGFMLKYNAKTGEVSSIDVSCYTQYHMNVFNDIVDVKGKLHFVPQNMNSILVYDLAHECAIFVDVSRFETIEGNLNWQLGVHLVEH